MNRSAQNGSSVIRVLAAAALLAMFGTVTAGPTRADDRDLLRKSAGEPYVFIVLDTSSSMHWAPRCPVKIPDPAHPGQFILDPADPADCAFQCETGDCFLPRNGDDPNSKIYQAKAALYEVIRRTTGIRFGFATYNQDQLRVTGKHWLYKAAGNGVTIPGYGSFPQAGDEEVFGRVWNCDEGTGDDEKGCLGTINVLGNAAAALDNAWERGRVQRLAKGGINFANIVTFYVRSTSTSTVNYRIRYEPPLLGSTPGQPVTIKVVRDTCPNNNCTGINALTGNDRAVADVVFNPVPGSEFLAWDQSAKRENPQLSYFSENSTDLVAAPDPPTLANTTSAMNNGTSTCSGLDLNTDSASDRFTSTYNLRWPTDTSDPRDSDFDVGDLIPLDWKTYRRTEILQRLAPNTVDDASATPNFGVSSYFNNTPNLLESFLRLKDEDERPILNRGLTPLKNSVRSFRQWYSGCPASGDPCVAGAGWKNDASALDADWGCRRKYLLVLTDGDETCKGLDGKTACDATAALRTDGVLTYVVAFGIDKGDTTPNVLGCMASNGGTGAPVYPQNKQDLVNALTTIFNQVKEEASAFASAAVPSVQAEVADRIYLSSFTPVDKKPVWDGHVDAFLKPLPLDVAGRPDESRACSSLPADRRSSCHLWDAGEELVKQAPTAGAIASAASLNASVLKIGPALDERRVFYGKAPSADDVPRSLRLFVPPGGNPATDPEWLDLFTGLKITGTPAAKQTRAEEIIAQTLVTKGTTAKPFVLGDIFHSDPVLVDRPNDFFFYGANLHNENGCGYKCFSDKQRHRRKLLVVGSNDGQLHFLDAGIWNDGPIFGTGTGRELFSFIPRIVLPIVRDLAEGTGHIYGIDGTPRADDIFIDPIHDGEPEDTDREWRTVLIGGLREGGGPMGQTRVEDLVSGYYALDITQPDKMNNDGEPVGNNVLPDCLSLNGAPVSEDCGDLPFPALLWEFTDSTAGSRWDEDLNGFADLGETWSVPTVGRVKVTVNNVVTEKFVAIFGGGMDADRKSSPKKGNWLYMVDVETGQPIYKRRLVGAVVADPAAIDVNVDGYLDLLYIGTSAGYVYKIDLSTPAPLETVILPKTSAIPHLGADVTTTRVLDPNSAEVKNESWDPVPIFDTIGRPIYYAPVAFYVASQNRFALTFGTGDRENLWDFTGQKGRFYLIIDDDFGPAELSAGTIPLDETDYQAIDPESLAPPVGTDYVLTPGTGKQGGWFMDLAANERVITQAFGLAGVVIFSSYRPAIDVQSTGGEQVCARTGESRIFVVYANNASPLMTVDGEKKRYRSVPEFVTNPYVEQGATKNPNNQTDDRHSEQLTAEQLEIMETLKKFFPACAKFGNYWISVSGIRSDTGYERYATIPIGICQRNWKEH